MRAPFIAFMLVLGFLVAFAIFPPAFDILSEFVDDVMPGLGFTDLIKAYVGAFPLILLGLFVLTIFWTVKSNR